MSPLNTDAIAARLNAYEKFKNGGYVDRGNGVSQLEVAQRIQATNNLHTHASADIAALLAEVATLRAALQPLACAGAIIDTGLDADELCPDDTKVRVVVGDLRRARRVLEGGTEEPQQ